MLLSDATLTAMSQLVSLTYSSAHVGTRERWEDLDCVYLYWISTLESLPSSWSYEFCRFDLVSCSIKLNLNPPLSYYRAQLYGMRSKIS